MDGQPQQQQQQQEELANFLGTTLDAPSSSGHESSSGGGVGEPSRVGSSLGGSASPSPQSSLVLSFLRERGLNPEDYGWRDDNAALGGLYSYLAELASLNRQYEAQLAQLRDGGQGKDDKAQAQAAKAVEEEKEPDWEKLPEYDPTWRFRQNEPAALEEMAKYARILQERNHKFHNNPIEYLRTPLDYYMKQQIKALREEIEKKLEEGLRTVRYESQLPWFIEDRRNLLFDKSGGATKYNEAYMDVFNNLVQQGFPRDAAMQKAEELVNRVWTRAIESASPGNNAANGKNDNAEDQAEAMKRRAVERHNRVPNRNGSEPRSKSDGPQNAKLSTRKRHELAYDKFFANGGK